MSLNIYFDAAKEKLDIERDAVLARHLGIRPQSLNAARKQGWCTDDVLEKLAGVLDVKMEELLLAREATKPHPQVMHAAWVKAYEKVRASGLVAVFIAAGMTGSAYETEEEIAPTVFITGNWLYQLRRFFFFVKPSLSL